MASIRARAGARTKAVGYVRVSTDKQGASGLGLEAQEEAIRRHCAGSGLELVTVLVEVETSTKATLDNRPRLREALKLCRRQDAVLVIAKLDRLARNVYVLSGLMESGCDFVACDNPHANRLTIQILAAVAEDEARRIGDRTRAALAAYKARGGLLGASRPESRGKIPAEAARRGSRVRGAEMRAEAIERDEPARDLALRLRAEGASLGAIAEALDQAGITTAGGGFWGKTQVSRLLKRAEALVF